MDAGLVKGEGFAVDASVIEANASRYHGKAPDEIDWSVPERQTRAAAEFLAGLEDDDLRRVLALRLSVWRDGALYPLARGARGIGRALGLVPALMVCSIDGGAGGELPGHRDRRPRDRSAGGCLRRALSPTFPSGGMVLFIPWRVAPAELDGRLGWYRR